LCPQGLRLVPSENGSRPPNGSTRLGAVLPCIFQAGHAISDYAPLEFGHRSDDREHSTPHWRRGIQSLLVRNEIDSQSSELFQGQDLLLGRTSESVESKNNHNLKRIAAGIGH
jgi:hypothetical protein